MAGFLPFSAIYIELHYIFNSIWGHKIYTLFGILFLAFIMLFIVTSFITIALIYFQVVSCLPPPPSVSPLPHSQPVPRRPSHPASCLPCRLSVQLAREDHRWWWRSFFNGGATGLFILGYSFFYYFQRSEMDGFFQVHNTPPSFPDRPLGLVAAEHGPRGAPPPLSRGC